MAYQAPQEAGDIGRVVLCSARDCSYNRDTKCVAQAVHIMLHSDHADCNTYTNNRHHSEMQMEEEM